MNVVTRAMRTSMVNRAGGMTFRSRPMLRMMSSVSPRVFMSTPRAIDSRHPIPMTRAATVEPPHLPATATSRISPQTPHRRSSPPRRPRLVRRPVKAKNRGRRNTTVKSSSLATSSPTSSERAGMTAPSRKAPKMAWIPMRSVARADRRMATNNRASTAEGSWPCCSW